MTAGGLKKEDLTKNKSGRIVSAKKNATMRNVYKDSDSEEEPPKEAPKETSSSFWKLFE
jgi:hypothetical protein